MGSLHTFSTQTTANLPAMTGTRNVSQPTGMLPLRLDHTDKDQIIILDLIQNCLQYGTSN